MIDIRLSAVEYVEPNYQRVAERFHLCPNLSTDCLKD